MFGPERAQRPRVCPNRSGTFPVSLPAGTGLVGSPGACCPGGGGLLCRRSYEGVSKGLRRGFEGNKGILHFGCVAVAAA